MMPMALGEPVGPMRASIFSSDRSFLTDVTVCVGSLASSRAIYSISSSPARLGSRGTVLCWGMPTSAVGPVAEVTTPILTCAMAGADIVMPSASKLDTNILCGPLNRRVKMKDKGLDDMKGSIRPLGMAPRCRAIDTERKEIVVAGQHGQGTYCTRTGPISTQTYRVLKLLVQAWHIILMCVFNLFKGSHYSDDSTNSGSDANQQSAGISHFQSGWGRHNRSLYQCGLPHAHAYPRGRSRAGRAHA